MAREALRVELRLWLLPPLYRPRLVARIRPVSLHRHRQDRSHLCPTIQKGHRTRPWIFVLTHALLHPPSCAAGNATRRAGSGVYEFHTRRSKASPPAVEWPRPNLRSSFAPRVLAVASHHKLLRCMAPKLSAGAGDMLHSDVAQSRVLLQSPRGSRPDKTSLLPSHHVRRTAFILHPMGPQPGLGSRRPCARMHRQGTGRRR
ncbi:hypothetical protein B0I35DRAFT_57603 [Stachybotrys elegans]|uniref:Uncharacterized protein n=1 Tax=Stachybotrys elegans TaxID=80388 RepID=A0A8K0SQX5_9HYPO|nr:hypothetical protein B0I35DRAFT_57603 [Stachybotrys elegans]